MTRSCAERVVITRDASSLSASTATTPDRRKVPHRRRDPTSRPESRLCVGLDRTTTARDSRVTCYEHTPPRLPSGGHDDLRLVPLSICQIFGRRNCQIFNRR